MRLRRLKRTRCSFGCRLPARTLRRVVQQIWGSPSAAPGPAWPYCKRGKCRGSGGEQLLALRPIEGQVEGATEAGEQRVDLVGRNDERRTDRHRVARERPHDEALLLGKAHALRRHHLLGIERLLRSLVGDEFDGTDKAQSARLADQR